MDETFQNEVVIMRGISGAGKSTYTNMNFPGAVVCSADFFFGRGDKYNFNPKLLGKAHDSCFNTFEAAMGSNKPVIVIDNTNTTLREFKRYVESAQKRGYAVKVVRLVVDPAIAAQRNVHGVPAEKVQQMQDRFQDYPGEIIVQNN